MNSSNAEVAPSSPRELVNNFIAEYKQVEKESESQEMPWESETTLKIELETPLFFEVSISSYAYTGGAHGNSYIKYMVLEKEHGGQIKLDSLLTEDAKENLVSLGEAAFRMSEDVGEMDLESAGYWFPENNFYLPDNFLYTSDGLMFIYNPYEVAAYARGYIEFILPYADIEPLIKEKYRLIPPAT